MLDITTLENALYTWIFGVMNITTIFAKPNAPRPKTGPYITIHVAQSVPLSMVEAEYTLNDDDEEDIKLEVDYSKVEELFVSINTFRTNALQNATKIKDSLDRVTVTDQLWASGLGYSRTSAVRDIDTVVREQWEERGQFDVFFNVRTLDEETITDINKIEITNNINDDGDTVVVERP